METMKTVKEVNEDFKPLNNEMDDFMRRHIIKHFNLDKYGILTLFEPLDEDKYEQIIYRYKNRYSPNELKIEDTEIHKDYYINCVNSLDVIDEVLKRIGEENSFPFKIIADAGFIVEDTKNVSYSHSYAARSIPSTIENEDDLDDYKTYVQSYISEKMELTHASSSYCFIALTTLLFSVTLMRRDNESVKRFNEVFD